MGPVMGRVRSEAQPSFVLPSPSICCAIAAALVSAMSASPVRPEPARTARIPLRPLTAGSSVHA
jgi:hypothetical protein